MNRKARIFHLLTLVVLALFLFVPAGVGLRWPQRRHEW